MRRIERTLYAFVVALGSVGCGGGSQSAGSTGTGGDGTGGDGMGGASSSSSASSSSTGSTSSSSSGATGGGGAGGSGSVCAPNAKEPCYEGPGGTEGVGICAAGMRTCAADGSAWGACTGQVTPMPSDDCANTADDDCSGSACAQGRWSRRFGDAESQTPTSVAANADGTFYVAGHFKGSVGFTSPALTSVGGFDVFLAKFSAAGELLWNKQLAGTSDEFAYGVAVDQAGNAVITGQFSGAISFDGGATTTPSHGGSDIFVAKFAPSGALLWSKTFGESSGTGPFTHRATAVAIDAGGNIILTGEHTGNVDFGDGGYTTAGALDAFVTKLSPDGMLVWSRHYGGPGFQTGKAVAVDASGNISVLGELTGTADFAGTTLSANAGAREVFLARLDPAGTLQWAKSFESGASMHSAAGLAVDASGSVIVSGAFRGTITLQASPAISLTVPHTGLNIFLAKLDASGAHQWSTQYGSATASGVGVQISTGVAVDAQGNIVFGGSCYDSVTLGTTLSCGAEGSPFLVRTDPNGAVLWSKVYGSTGGTITDVAVSSPSAIIAIADMGPTIDFGNGELVSSGFSDIAVASIAPE